MTMKLIVVFIAVLMYALIVTFEKKKLLVSSGAALLIVVLATIFPEKIFPLPEDVLAVEGRIHVHAYALIHSVTEIIDWNCILLLVGSMFMSSVLIASKSMELAACEVMVKKRNLFSIYLILALMTAIVTVFAGNVAAVTIFVPLAIAVFTQAQLNPVPAVVLLSMISNVEMFASVLASPASMIFAGFSGFRFNDFIVHDGRPSVFIIAQSSIALSLVLFRFICAKYRKHSSSVHIPLNVSRVPLYFLGFAVLGLCMMSFFNHRMEIAVGIFMFMMGIVSLVWYRYFFTNSSADFYECLCKIDFGKIAYIAGLFIVSRALKESGVLPDVSEFILSLSKDSMVACFAIVFFLSLAVGFVLDAMACISVIYPVACAVGTGFDVFPNFFVFASLAGLSMGNSLSPYFSLSNVIASEILNREGMKISTGEWMKKGAPFALSALAASVVFLMLFMR